MTTALQTLRAPTDLDVQEDLWGANCGPASLAAALGLDVADVRTAVEPFAGYMNVRHMLDALDRLDAKSVRVSMTSLAKAPVIPHSMIIVLVAWSGPWDPVPRAAAQYRHWVVRHPEGIYDVNSGWVSHATWEETVRPPLIPPRGNGSYSIARASAITSFRGQVMR